MCATQLDSKQVSQRKGRTSLTQEPSSTPNKLYAALLIAAALLYTALAVLINPYQHHLFNCPFHEVTGKDCPFCGTTRALYALAHGRVLASVEANPLFFILAPALLYEFVAWTTNTYTRKTLPRLPKTTKALYVYAGLIGIFWVARALPTPWTHYIAP